jgi:hypothetical protein
MLTQKDLDEIENVVDEQVEERTRNLPSKDEFFEKMDEVMGELKGVREDFKIMTGKVYEDHEPRITKIEKKVQITASS